MTFRRFGIIIIRDEWESSTKKAAKVLSTGNVLIIIRNGADNET